LSEIFFSENSGSRLWINASVSSITVKVFTRKSIFSRPKVVQRPIEYWLITSLPFTSRQSGM
jgi:hypothetical protein